MLNQSVLMGRLTAEPELRTTNTGTSVTSFTIAVDREYQTNGERQTDFFPIVAWRQTAEWICRYFHKGSMIAVIGNLQNRRYEGQDGIMRTVTELVVSHASFCGNKTEGSGTTRYDTKPIDTSNWQPASPDTFSEFIDDDEDYEYEQTVFK